MRQNAAVKFLRGDQRGFNVQMRVDKARNNDFAGNVNLGCAFIAAAGADNAVTTDGYVGGDNLPGDQIEKRLRFSARDQP